MRTWKGWTHGQRMASFEKTKAAIKAGEISRRPCCCWFCSQKKGLLSWHNTDYSDPVKFLIGLCWRCHMVLHSEHISPAACGQYWADIKTGFVYPPVFCHDFKILVFDHGIGRGRK